MTKFQIFVSFTGADRNLKDGLKTCLAPLQEEFITRNIDIVIWDMDDKCIGLWNDRCRGALRESRMVLCLLTDNIRPDSVVFEEINLAAELNADKVLSFLPVIFNSEKRLDSITGRLTQSAGGAEKTFDLSGYTQIFGTDNADIYSQIYTKVKGAAESELGRLSNTRVTASQSKPFIGRETEMSQIQQAFDSGSNIVLLYGLGGIGKTEIATRYALRHKDEYTDMCIIDASGAGGTSIKDIITLLSFAGTPDIADSDTVFNTNMAYLKRLPPSTILIIDGWDVDLDTVPDLQNLIGNTECRIAMTSRHSCAGLRAIRINELSEEEAVRMFREYCGTGITDAEILQMVDAVERHTLTVELMAKLLQTNHAVSAERLKKSVLDVKAQCVNKSTKATIHDHIVNLFNLSKFSDKEKEILGILSYICRLGLTGEELVSLAGLTEENGDLPDMLAASSFVRNCDGRYSLHTLISEVVFEEIGVDEKTLTATAKLLVDKTELDQSADFEQKRLQLEYGTHFLYNRLPDLHQRLDDCRPEQKNDFLETMVVLVINTGYIYYHLSDYAAAMTLYETGLLISVKIYGACHQTTAACYNNIASIYDSNGEYDKALEYYMKALTICETKSGKEDPGIATYYNNIGETYNSKGEYDKALEYHMKALAIREKVLGPGHPLTSACYNNIGSAYRDMGEYDKALEYYNKDTVTCERIFGTEHPDTATCYNNIGAVYSDMGEYEKALEYSKKATAICERIFGTEHPTNATNYNNIGSVYRRMGECDKALEYHMKALAVRKKVFGTEHPDTADSYYNIGLVYDTAGEYGKALEFHMKALSIRKKVLGTNHAETAISLFNIGSTYRDMCKYGKALKYYKKALAIRKKVLGAMHPDTADSYYFIGYTYFFKEKYIKAIRFLTKALIIRKAVFGDDHFLTVDTLKTIEDIFGMFNL